MNAITQYARDYQKYLDMRVKITLEQKLAKDGWVRKFLPLMGHVTAVSTSTSASVMDSASSPSNSSKLSSRVQLSVWSPSSASWTPRPHPLDKVGPAMHQLKVMRGYYEAINAQNGRPACEACGLPHDFNVSTCHWHKFPAFRTKAFKNAYALALRNGYIKESEVAEWNNRPGREVSHRCDSSGRHPSNPHLQDLRSGVGGAGKQ